MFLSNLFKNEKYLRFPMADGESDYIYPYEREAALGSQRGDGDQLRLAFDRELRAKMKQVTDDISGHGAQMYFDKKAGYYRLEFNERTVIKFSVGRWKTFNLSMRVDLLKNALRIIITRIEKAETERLEKFKVNNPK
ncbi:MAG TPA: hypothetical protein DEA18_07870 [Dehalococcoidia bacterium]|nr:hypothetical protein [Dehalococcoidia bacterium]